jgi:hypothetical protein
VSDPTNPTGPIVVGPALTQPSRAGRAPVLTIILDLNGDGVPDFKQPEQIAHLLGQVVGLVSTLIPNASPTARVLAPIEAVLPAVEAALGGKL